MTDENKSMKDLKSRLSGSKDRPMNNLQVVDICSTCHDMKRGIKKLKRYEEVKEQNKRGYKQTDQ